MQAVCLNPQILHGCPWVLPRPVYVLTCKGKGSDTDQESRSMYTLRTKVKQEGAADALAKVCTSAQADATYWSTDMSQQCSLMANPLSAGGVSSACPVKALPTTYISCPCWGKLVLGSSTQAIVQERRIHLSCMCFCSKCCCFVFSCSC